MDLFSFFSPALWSCLLILVLTSISIIWKKKKCRIITNKPPQPPTLPLIGNLHQLVSKLPHRRLAKLAKTYGPFMQLQLGQVSAVVVSSPEVAKQMFKDNDIHISNRCRVSVADILFYNRQDIGFAPHGEYWRQMRKISMSELFSAKRVQSFRSIREEETSDFITSISSKVGSPINISEMLFCLISSILSRTVIGRKNENQEALIPLLNRIMYAASGFGVLDMFPSLEFIHVITGMKYRLLKLHKQADQLLEDIIKEHKADRVESERNNLLDVLMKLKENPDSLLTTEGVKAITLEFLVAGTDSSATILEWAMSEMMKNPRIMKKAQEEVRKVRAENGKLDESVIYKLKFLKAIIKETLRLHPPVSFLPRLCEEECKINGYDISAKSEVLVNVWAIGRDPNYWIEAETFNPERFVNRELDYIGCNFEYIPFGAGRRICPGIQLGVADIELAFAKLLCDFDWKLPNQMKPEDLDMIESFALAVTRKNQLILIPVAPQYPSS
ncbi:cytochrome P450 family 71 subfamily B polypeptide 12 [Euphorbia peplus]|nr:cytochrome P450 family 71 subfamily B polypeptide 12 [Euphorbia peplus]